MGTSETLKGRGFLTILREENTALYSGASWTALLSIILVFFRSFDRVRSTRRRTNLHIKMYKFIKSTAMLYIIYV